MRRLEGPVLRRLEGSGRPALGSPEEYATILINQSPEYRSEDSEGEGVISLQLDIPGELPYTLDRGSCFAALIMGGLPSVQGPFVNLPARIHRLRISAGNFAGSVVGTSR